MSTNDTTNGSGGGNGHGGGDGTEHDDEPTSPDLPSGLGTSPEKRGSDLAEDASVAIIDSARRALAALSTLEQTCPGKHDPGRRRHLEVLVNQWGEFGMLAFDTRRVKQQQIREEEEETP